MLRPSLTTCDLTRRFGGHVAVNRATCAFHPGETTVIVRPNGAGKTTYFNLISGQLSATSGKVHLGETDITGMSTSTRARHGIGPAFQLTNLFAQLSGLGKYPPCRAGPRRCRLGLFRPADALVALKHSAEKDLEAAHLSDKACLPTAALPHGDQRKLEVARLMAMEPDIYTFDEPTAGMSLDQAPAVLDLIAQIKRDPATTVLLVEHKMDVVRALADRIIVLHNGELPADGPPAQVMASQIVRNVYRGTATEQTT